MVKDTYNGDEFIAWLFLIAVLAFIIAAACVSWDDFKTQCEAHGGTAISRYKQAPLCVRRGALINLE